MQSKISFTNRNGTSLSGVLHQAAGNPRGYALFAHCFTCGKNIRAAVHIADALNARGYSVLRFDFTGLGQSGGEFADTDFSHNVGDLEDAARWLADNHEAPALLVGHSLGGTAVLAAAARLPSVRAVATVNAPAEAEHILHHLQDDIDSIEQDGEAQVKLAGRPFRIKKQFLEDVRGQTIRAQLADLRRALLVLHSPVDTTVDVQQATQIFTAARHPKSFVSLDDADHLLSREADAVYAAGVIAAWAERYLPALAPGGAWPVVPAATREPDGSVTACAAVADGFLSLLDVDGHPLVADEPADLGGGNAGPDPYDFLSASLATCTAMTLNFYARREKIPLSANRVTVRWDRIHASDCADCDSEDGRVHEFQRQIELQGDLSAAQRQDLLRIADKCPVHKTLEAEIKVRSQLVDDTD